METHDTYSPAAALRDAAATRVRALELGQFTRRDIPPLAVLILGFTIGTFGNIVEGAAGYLFIGVQLALTLVAVTLGARRIQELGVNAGLPSSGWAPYGLMFVGLFLWFVTLPLRDVFDLHPLTPLVGLVAFIACIIVGSWWAARLAARRLDHARAELAALDAQVEL